MTNVPPPAPDAQPAPAPEYAQPAPSAPYAQPAPEHGLPQAPAAVAPPTKKQRNILGLIALIVSAVGFIFACIPGALIVGWVLLPIGFILGIVSLFLKGKVKWQGVTAIIVSIVGTIIGIIVFTVVVATAFNDAFGGSDVEVGSPTSVTEETDAPANDEGAAAEAGTRENPIALGTPFSSSDWTVVVNSVTLDANAQIAAENPYNEAPDAGSVFILVNYTVTYIGTDPEGQMPAFVGLDYVTADGVTIDPLEKLVLAPEAMNSTSPLYEGASATGNYAIQVPSPVDGVLAVRAGMITDKVFVAVQ
ncbi:hypothetical protein [Microbacterium sp. NPDC089696]|uniref:hypothetical protein n=1 Tax=Microbacterium sp. NPDC089696 TaxID=3364199 RepID=UPI0037FEB498